MENSSYFKSFEESMTSRLLTTLSSLTSAPTGSLIVEELNEKWNEIAPEYMMEAVKEFNDYPTATLAWAAYLGMALAKIWDLTPVRLQNENLYGEIVSKRGWDEMDEYISQIVLGNRAGSIEEKELSNTLLTIAKEANTLLRRESLEPGTSNAFYGLASTLKVMFSVGVSLQLYNMGYRYEKVEIKIPPIS